MNIYVLAVVIVSIIMSTTAQILLKLGMSAPAVHASIASGHAGKVIIAVMQSTNVLGGFLAFGISLVLWLFVLSRIPVSVAYPFVSLGIAATVVGGYIILGESLYFLQVIGILLIISGVITIGAGA